MDDQQSSANNQWVENYLDALVSILFVDWNNQVASGFHNGRAGEIARNASYDLSTTIVHSIYLFAI